MSRKQFVVTTHAIHRYWERVERCSKRDAIDRLLHAASIARPPSARQLRRIKLGYGPRLLFCDVESLLLVCSPIPEKGKTVIKTVYRLLEESKVPA